MNTTAHAQKVAAEHGVIASFPDEFFGYFGWPSITRMANGTLAVVASGLRHAHVCPFGRTVICFSQDEGRTWTSPVVVNDTPIDDRDAGILALGGNKLLVSWFTSDMRRYKGHLPLGEDASPELVQRYGDALRRFDDATVDRWLGSWVRRSDDGGETWETPLRVAVTAPHGPIRLGDGSLLYLGKTYQKDAGGAIQAWRSQSDGELWEPLGSVPLIAGTVEANYHEPHVAELPDGRLIGLIRIEDSAGAPNLAAAGVVHFSMAQSESHDGGLTWTPAHPLGFHGSPPHLLQHSSGALIAVYGYRLPPYGQRAMVSTDGGATWIYDYVLRDDGPDGDLGYPASVELSDGSVLTICYQKAGHAEEKCSLLWTRWRPAELR